MSLILTSRTRTRQPQQNTRLSAAYPRPAWVTLPTGGMFASGYPGGVRNLVKPTEVATPTDANNTFTQGATPFGIAAVNASIGVGGLNANATRWEVTTDALCGATEITLLSSFWRRGATDESTQWLNFRTDYSHSMDVFASTATTLTFGADWAGAWNGASQQTVTIGDGLVTIIAVIRQDGARFFCNGVMTGTKAGSGFTVGSTPYAVMINSGARSPILFQEAWKAALSDAQALQLSRNPWDAFAPQRTARIYSFPTAGGAAALEGSLAASATVSAALTSAIRPAASVAASATVAAALSTSIRPAASVAASATVTAALTTAIRFASSVSASASIAGDISGAAAFASTLSASAIVTGALSTAIRLNASVIGAATVAGVLAEPGAAAALEAAIYGYATVSANLTGGTSTIWTPASASSGTWTPASAAGGTWVAQ